VENNTNTGLISFMPNPPKHLEPFVRGDVNSTHLDMEHGEMLIDKIFHGLTQLYPTLPDQRVAIEKV